MSVKKTCGALSAIIALTAFGGAVYAAPAPASAAAAVAVEPEATALARRLLKAMGVEAQTDAMLAAILPALAERQASRIPNLTAADRQLLTETIRDLMRETFTPRMIEEMIPAYASTFTRTELEGMVAFYEGPVGRASIEKMPALMGKSAEISRALLPEMQVEMLKRLCARFDCSAPTRPPPRANPS
jgi:uncharacterized protein